MEVMVRGRSRAFLAKRGGGIGCVCEKAWVGPGFRCRFQVCLLQGVCRERMKAGKVRGQKGKCVDSEAF